MGGLFFTGCRIPEVYHSPLPHNSVRNLNGPANLQLDFFKCRELGEKSKVAITMPHRNFVFHGNCADQTIVGGTYGESATAALSKKFCSGYKYALGKRLA